MINDRIKQIVDEFFRGNKTQFALAIGIPPTSITNYIGSKRASKPSSDMLEKIVLAVNVDAMWLLTGRGQMRRADLFPSPTAREDETAMSRPIDRAVEDMDYKSLLIQLMNADTAVARAEALKKEIYAQIADKI